MCQPTCDRFRRSERFVKTSRKSYRTWSGLKWRRQFSVRLEKKSPTDGMGGHFRHFTGTETRHRHSLLVRSSRLPVLTTREVSCPWSDPAYTFINSHRNVDTASASDSRKGPVSMGRPTLQAFHWNALLSRPHSPRRTFRHVSQNLRTTL
jgi:hypothetical protein